MSHFKCNLRIAVMLTALFLLCAGEASAACLGVGTVKADGLRLRAAASTDSAILDTAGAGAHAVVLEDTGSGWYKVNYNAAEGYMSAEYLDVAAQADAELGCGRVQTSGSQLNVRSGPDTGCAKVAALPNGTVVNITGTDSGWFKITYKSIEGYVSGDYLVPGASGPQGGGSTGGSATGRQIVDYAKQYLGAPYVWGGSGPDSFDCSGFTYYVYTHLGYRINRTATAQLSNGVSVSRSELQPGDLVFFHNDGDTAHPVSHVGIYVGDGQFIHASSNSYTVEYSSLYASNYDRKYVCARRIV